MCIYIQTRNKNIYLNDYLRSRIRIIQSQGIKEVSVVSTGESDRRLVVDGGEVAATDDAISVGHSDIVICATFLWKLINTQNSLHWIRKPVVDSVPECSQPVTAPPRAQQNHQQYYDTIIICTTSHSCGGIPSPSHGQWGAQELLQREINLTCVTKVYASK